MEYRGPLPDVEIPDISLYDLIFTSLTDAESAETAIVHEATGQSLTYAQVRQDVDAVAAWLTDQGVGPGSVVAVVLPNSPEYVTAFHGILRAGATVTPVNAAYTATEISGQLTETSTVMIITNPTLLPQVSAAASEVGLPSAALVVVDPTGSVAGAGFTPYTALTTYDGAPPALDIDAATHVACLPFSSGTTGMPKAVMLSHRNLVANVLQFAPVLDPLGPHQSFVAFLPFSHIYALTTNMNFGLLRRYPIMTMPAFSPMDFLAIVAKHRPTMLFVVPPVASFLAKHPAAAGLDWTSVQLVVCGAAPLDGPVGQALADRLDCQVIQGYGMTELSPVTHVMPVHRPDIDHGTIGLAIPNIRFRVVDPDTGADVEPPTPEATSASGELWCRGPNAMLGYLGHPADTDAVLDGEGWIHTGDLVTVDHRGAVRVVDRIKELIKLRGFQIAPAELEAVLCSHPAVADAAVIGVDIPHSRGDQVPHALVQLQPDAEVSATDLMAYVADRLAKYKHVKSVQFIEKVPRSAAGKILRRVLPELASGSVAVRAR